MEIPNSMRKEVDDYVKQKGLKGEKEQKVWDMVQTIYAKSLYDPQEPVGVVTAQSLSEPTTQMTMRTYHFAGTAGIQVTLGLPRMLEIFDARKEPRTPAMTVKVLDEFQNMDEVKRIADEIKEVKVKDIVISTVIDLSELWVKCRLDMDKLKSLRIDVEKLPKLIKMRNVDIKLEGDSVVATPKKSDVSEIHKLKYALLETHVKGIKGISQVVVSKEDGKWLISTLGSNLKKVFDIEGVDVENTTTNNIFEVYDVLGIEAARRAIIDQAVYTMEEQGLGVDIRYIMLLADLMTMTGSIKAIGRYGISGQKASVLVRASFEETKKHFINAAVKGESDGLHGTIENIMMNQVAPIGTGAFQLIGSISRKPKKPKK